MTLRTVITKTTDEVACGVRKATLNRAELVAVRPGHRDGAAVVAPRDIEEDAAKSVADSTSGQTSAHGSAPANLCGPGLQVPGAIGGPGGSGTAGQDAPNSKLSRVVFKMPVSLTAHMRNAPAIKDERDLMHEPERRK